MNTFRMIIRTPDGTAADREVVSLVVPGPHGHYGLLARHAPLVGSVAVGLLRLHAPDGPAVFVVGDGVLRVDAHGVELLLDHAERAADPADAEEKQDLYLRSLRQPPAVLTGIEEP